MRNKLAVCIAVLGMISTTACVNAFDLISNGGFENPLGPENSILVDNWSTFISDFGPAAPAILSDDPLSGAAHLSMAIEGFDDAFVGIQQTSLVVQAGEEYTFSGFARGVGELGVGAEFRLEWLDVNSEFVGGQFDTNQTIALSDAYTRFSAVHIAPDNATQLRAVIAVESIGDGNNFGTVYFDDISLQIPSAVPEPASMTLLILGIVGLVSRRRR